MQVQELCDKSLCFLGKRNKKCDELTIRKGRNEAENHEKTSLQSAVYVLLENCYNIDILILILTA